MVITHSSCTNEYSGRGRVYRSDHAGDSQQNSSKVLGRCYPAPTLTGLLSVPEADIEGLFADLSDYQFAFRKASN